MLHKSFDVLGLTKWWLVDTSAEPSFFQLCRGETMSTMSDSSGVHLAEQSIKSTRLSSIPTPTPPAKATNKVHFYSHTWEFIHLWGSWILQQYKPTYFHDEMKENTNDSLKNNHGGFGKRLKTYMRQKNKVLAQLKPHFFLQERRLWKKISRREFGRRHMNNDDEVCRYRCVDWQVLVIRPN